MSSRVQDRAQQNWNNPIDFGKISLNLIERIILFRLRILKNKTFWYIKLSFKKMMGSTIGPNCVIARDVKSCTFCYYVRCVTLMVRVGGMHLCKTGTTHNHAQLWLTDKSRAIKGLVILGHAQSACVWSLVVVRMAIKLKYRNTPQLQHNIT